MTALYIYAAITAILFFVGAFRNGLRSYEAVCTNLGMVLLWPVTLCIEAHGAYYQWTQRRWRK